MITSPLFRRIKESIFHRFIGKYSLISADNYRIKKLIFAPKNQMKLFGAKDIISDNIAYLGYYEWELSSIIQELSKEAKVMVDAGANMGYFSILFLANATNGIIYSFEPNPPIFKLLEENIQMNKFSNNAFIYNQALAAQAGKLNFSFGSQSEQSGWGHIDPNSNSNVIATTIDESVPEDTIIDILKIDVEGYEFEVLKGAKQAIQDKRVKNIFFELNEGMLHANGLSGDTLLGFLNEVGYQIQNVTNEIAWAKLH